MSKGVYFVSNPGLPQKEELKDQIIKETVQTQANRQQEEGQE